MTRVKIKKIPKMDVGGSYLERTPGYTDTRFTYFGNKATSPSKDEGQTNGSVGPVDRDVAEYEAEKGEVLFRNSNPDETGKSRNGGLFKINGKKHEKGGTPLIGKEGDFIISDNPDLHIPIEHQKEMQLKTSSKKTKKDNTPAKVLLRNVDPKQYNKHLSTLMDPNKDEISKNTASISLEGFNQIIQKIARYQEGNKSGQQTHDLADTTAAEEQQQFGGNKQLAVKQAPPEEMMEQQQPAQQQPIKRNGGYTLRKAYSGMLYGDNPTDSRPPVEGMTFTNPSTSVNAPATNNVVIPQITPGSYTMPGSLYSSDKVVNPYAIPTDNQRTVLPGFGQNPGIPTYKQKIDEYRAANPDFRFIPTPPSQEYPDDVSGGIDLGNYEFNPMDWWSQQQDHYDPRTTGAITNPDLYTINTDVEDSKIKGPLPINDGMDWYGKNRPMTITGNPDLYRIATPNTPAEDWGKEKTNPLPQVTNPTVTPEQVAAAQQAGFTAPVATTTPVPTTTTTTTPPSATTTVTPTGNPAVATTTAGNTAPAATNTSVGTTTNGTAGNAAGNAASATGGTGVHAGDADYVHVDKYNYPDLKDDSGVANLQALKTMMLLNNANKRYLTPANQYVHTDLKQREYDPSEAIKQAKQQGTLNREMLSRYANPQQAALALSQSQTADQLARINADAQAKNITIGNQNAAMNWQDANAIARRNIDAKLQNQMMNNRVLANSQNQMTKALLDQTTYEQMLRQGYSKANALNRMQNEPYGAVRTDPKTGRTTMEYPFLSNGKFNPNYPGGWNAYAVKQQQLAKDNTLGLPSDDVLGTQLGMTPDEIKKFKREYLLATVTGKKTVKKKKTDNEG